MSQELGITSARDDPADFALDLIPKRRTAVLWSSLVEEGQIDRVETDGVPVDDDLDRVARIGAVVVPKEINIHSVVGRHHAVRATATNRLSRERCGVEQLVALHVQVELRPCVVCRGQSKQNNNNTKMNK